MHKYADVVELELKDIIKRRRYHTQILEEISDTLFYDIRCVTIVSPSYWLSYSFINGVVEFVNLPISVFERIRGVWASSTASKTQCSYQ